jgi:hypothetical protein
MASEGQKPTKVRINPECYRKVVDEYRVEMEKMRKRAARLFKADWKNPMDLANEVMPIDCVFTRTGQLKFLLDDGILEGYQLEE